MPLKGLICRSELQVVEPPSADHWDGECRNVTMDVGMLEEALARQVKRDEWKKETIERLRKEVDGGPWFEVTELIGGLRDTFIRRHLPFWKEAQGFSSTEIGVAVGDHAEKGLLKRGWVTQELVFGRLFGVNVFGKMDARKGDWTKLRDYKHKNTDSFYWQQKRGFIAGDGDAVQVNIYLLLARQMRVRMWGEMVVEIPPDVELEVMYSANNKAADKSGNPLDSWHPTRAPHFSEEEIAAQRLSGNLLTVGEVAKGLLESQLRVENGEDPVKVAQDVGMTCAEMFGKQKCKLYCDSAYTCYGVQGLDVARLGKPRIFLPGLVELTVSMDSKGEAK